VTRPRRSRASNTATPSALATIASPSRVNDLARGLAATAAGTRRNRVLPQAVATARLIRRCPKGVAGAESLVVGYRACGGRPMITDLAVVGVGAFLILVALIWKAYRVIDERLSEIQADISELQNALFLLASKSDAKTSNPALVAPGDADTIAHRTDELVFLRSPGLESDLTAVGELCAKLITLVPPAEAATLISAVPLANVAPLIPEIRAERPTQFKDRRRLLSRPTRGSG
jgi:hypothetical protein